MAFKLRVFIYFNSRLFMSVMTFHILHGCPCHQIN